MSPERYQPSVGEGAGVLLGRLVVAARGVGAAGEQRARLAVGDVLVELVDEAHLVVRAHRAALRGADDVLGVVEAGVVEQPLGHPEDLLQRAAEYGPDLAGQLVGQARAADLQDAQRRDLVRRRARRRGRASARRPRGRRRCA